MVRIKVSALVVLGVLVAGCSDDASSEDGTGDGGAGGTGGSAGATSVPESWPVHVEVADMPASSTPLAVLISAADGSTYNLVETDANGKADVDVPHLGSVSVFQSSPHPTIAELTVGNVSTYANVDEEATFRAEIFDYGGAPPTLAETITFNVDPTTLPTGTDRVVVQVPCEDTHESSGGPTNPIVFESPDGCGGATEYYAVALALDASGMGLAATVLPHLPLATGAVTHTIAFDTTAFVNFEPDISPTDPATDDVSIEVRSWPPGASYGKYAYVKSIQGIAHPVGSEKLTVPVVVDFFTKFSLVGSVTHVDLPGVMQQRIDRRFLTATTFPASFSVDTSIAPFASVSNEFWEAVDRPKVTFSLEPGALGSCVAANMTWAQQSPSLTSLTQWSWADKAKPSGVFQVPELPPTLVGYAPNAESTFMEWGGGVSHLQKAVPCADLTAGDLDTRYARGPAPE